MTAVCRSLRRSCRLAVYLETGFSGLVLCVEKANFDSESLGMPLSEKKSEATAAVSAGVMPMPASDLAPCTPAAYSRNALAAAALSELMAGLMPRPVGSPKVTGVAEVPVVRASYCGAGAMPHGEGAGSPVTRCLS